MIVAVAAAVVVVVNIGRHHRPKIICIQIRSQLEIQLAAKQQAPRNYS